MSLHLEWIWTRAIAFGMDITMPCNAYKTYCQVLVHTGQGWGSLRETTMVSRTTDMVSMSACLPVCLSLSFSFYSLFLDKH